MLHNELHLRIEDVAARVVAHEGDADFDELDAHAARGCSVCARALVNAQDQSVDVAMGVAIPPRAGLRQRVLEAARRHAPASVATNARPVRIPDPSAAVAHLHVGAPGDAERTAFIDKVAALEPQPREASAALLVEIELLTGIPLLFVSIVRGERVAYRVQRGLDEQLTAFRAMRREITFCTHCVASGLPLVVPDAGREPFFRASKMVTRFGIRSYVGVPLRSASGIVFGTVCALDFAPRALSSSVVRLLQLYAEPIAAEVEDVAHERPEPIGEAFAHRFGWFERLLDLQVERGREGRASDVLLTVEGPRASALADAADVGEPLGRVGANALGLLVPNVSMAEAAARAAEIRARFGGLEVRFATTDRAANGAELRDKALGKA